MRLFQVSIIIVKIKCTCLYNQFVDHELIKDSLIQILAMIAKQERTESKRRQTQGIRVAKTNGVYKGRPKLYITDTKHSQRRLVYKNIIEDLNQGIAISKIAKD